MANENHVTDSGYTGSAYDVSLETPAMASPQAGLASDNAPQERLLSLRHRKMLFLVNGAVLLLIALIGIASFLIAGATKSSGPPTSQKATNYAVSSLPVDQVKSNIQLQLGQADHLTINGQVIVGNTLVLAPTSTPNNPTAGQIYYDQTTNQPYYYNGSQFVSFAQTQGSQQVTSLGGSTGAISVGGGLRVAANQLSLQLQAGNGITVNGQTVTNTGVVSLTPGTSNIDITHDGKGNYTISDHTIGLITGTGTPGTIALFTSGQSLGDSILSQSGSGLTVAGSMSVQGSSTLTGLLTANGGINLGGNFLQSGGGTFGTGTGTVSLNGDTTVAGSHTLTVGTGATVLGGTLNVTGAITANTLQSAASTDLHINAGGDGSKNIFFYANGTSYALPAPVSSFAPQTICTTDTGCASGLGAAVILGPLAAQTDNNSTGSSIWINSSTSANLLQLETGAANKFVVGNSGNTTIAGTLAVQAGGVTLGGASTQGSLTLYNGANSNTGTLVVDPALALATTYTLPNDPGRNTDIVCLFSLGNCASAGGGVTTLGGTNNYIAKFTGSQTLGNASIYDNGSGVSIGSSSPVGLFNVGTTNQFQVSSAGAIAAVGVNSGTGLIQGTGGLSVSGGSTLSTLAVQGAGGITVGNAAGNVGVLKFLDGTNDGFTANLGPAAPLSGNLVFTLPSTGGTLCTTTTCASGSGNTYVQLQNSTPGSQQVGNLNINGTGILGTLSVTTTATIGTGLTVTSGGASITGGLTSTGTTTLSALGAGLVQSGSTGILSSGTADRNSSTFFVSNLSVANGGSGTNTLALNGILYGNGTSAIQATAAAANSILATNGTNVPGLTQTLPTAVQGNITSVSILGLNSGSIISGFGTISTGSTITTTSTVQGGTVIATGALQGNALSINSGTFTVNSSGAITAATGLTSSGTITLSSLGAGIAHISSSGVITSAPVALGVDTSGNYVAGIKGAVGAAQGGTITFANTAFGTGGSSNTIIINDASTTQKGIAQFNSTNFSAASGTINTIQDIATTASPTFNALTLQSTTTALSINGPPSGTTSLIQLGAALGTSAGSNINSNGTFIGLNATSGSADFLNFQNNGVSKLRVDSSGNILTTGSLSVISNTGSTVSLTAPAGLGSTLSFALPSSYGSGNNLCLKESSAGVTAWQLCTSSSGGGGSGSSSILNAQTNGLAIQPSATFMIQAPDDTTGNVIEQGSTSGLTQADLLQFRNNGGTVTSAFSSTGQDLRLDGAVLSGGNYTAALMIGSSGATTAADGINLGGDTQLYRTGNGALNLQSTANVSGQSATTNITLQVAPEVGGSNLSGATLIMASGQSTGTGNGGDIRLEVSPPPSNLFTGAWITTASATNDVAVDANPADTPSFLFFTSSSFIGESNIAGTSVNSKWSGNIGKTPNLIANCLNGQNAGGTAGTAGFIFYDTNSDDHIGLIQYNPSSGALNTAATNLISIPGTLNGIACFTPNNGSHDTYVFYTTASSPNIGVFTVSYTGAVTTTPSDPNALTSSSYVTISSGAALGVAVDPTGNYLYWLNNSLPSNVRAVDRACLSASGGNCGVWSTPPNATTVDASFSVNTVSSSFATGSAVDLTVTSSNLYVSRVTANLICTASLTIQSPVYPLPCNPIVGAGSPYGSSNGPGGLTSSPSALYWSNGVANPAPKSIGRLIFGGSTPNTEVAALSISGSSGAVTVQNANDATNGFNVQNAEAMTEFNVNTVNSIVSAGGQLAVTGGISTTGLTAPTISSVTKSCTGGSCSAVTYGYAVTAVNGSGGESLPSSTVTVTNATSLSSTATNKIVWANTFGAASYNIYRASVSGGTMNVGLVANVSAGQGNAYTDDGSNNTAGTVPTVDSSGNLSVAGPALFKGSTNATNAFQVQDTGGNNWFAVDTKNGRVGIGMGTSNSPGNLLSIGALTTPSSGAQVAVSTGGIGNSGIVVQTVLGQSSGNILQAQDSTGASLATIDYQGNLTVKAATINGTLTVNGHIISGNVSGSTTGTGLTGACSVAGAAPTVTGNDTAGLISYTTANSGTCAGAPGRLLQLSFANTYGANPYVVITAASANAAPLQFYVDPANVTTSGFILSVNANASLNTTYKFYYHVFQ